MGVSVCLSACIGCNFAWLLRFLIQAMGRAVACVQEASTGAWRRFFGASGEGDVATVGHLNAIRNGHMGVGTAEAPELSLTVAGMS